MTRTGLRWVGLLALLPACQQPDTSQVVARIGERPVRAPAFEEMARRLLAGPYRDAAAVDDSLRAELLRAVLAKELLIDEARRRGLHEADADELDELEARLLTRQLYEGFVFVPVPATEEGLDSLAAVSGYRDEVRFRHVMCLTRADAEAVIDAVRQGRAVADLARERSVHRPTAPRGGDMGFVPLADMLPEVEGVVAGLQPGEVHMEPVRSRYGYHVFQLVERRRVGLDAHRLSVENLFRVRQHERQVDAYLDSLAGTQGLRCDDESLPVPCRWNGGQLPRRRFHSYLRHSARGDTTAPEARRRHLWRAAQRALALGEARRLGLHEAPAVSGPLRQRREELLGRRIEQAVTAGVEVTEEQVRAWYDDHPQDYGERPAAQIQEIFATDAATAQQVRQRLDAGEDFDALAAAFHERESTRSRNGRMDVVLRDNARLGPLAPRALDGEVGQVVGPLQVPGGWSVFRIEGRRPQPGRAYESARHAIRTILTARARNQRMDAFLDSLTAAAAPRIQVFPEVLARTLQGARPGQTQLVEQEPPSIWESGASGG